MSRTISTSDAQDQLNSAITWIEEHGDDVIVETEGHPRAVIMSFEEYEEIAALKERLRREEAIREIRRLKEQVSARNRDLTDEEALALADRFVREVIDDMTREGKVVFERDRS